MAKKIVNDVLKKTKTAKKAAEAVTKNADEGVTAVRKMTGNFNGKITELQNKIDSGVPISSAVSDYLDQREKVNNAVAKRRALNEASQSQGKGNRANRRAKEIDDNKLANAIADGRELAKQQRDLADMSHSRQSRINQKNAQAQEISDARRSIRNDNKKINNEINNEINKIKNEELYTWADKNGYDIMDDKQLKQAKVVKARNDKIAAQREAMKDYDDIYNKIGYSDNFYSDRNTIYSDRKVTEKNSIFAQEYGSDNVKATGYTSKTALEDALNNNANYKEKLVIERRKKDLQTDTSSPSGGNSSIMQQVQDKVKGNNFVYNMAAMGVGGGLVLNMANNKGQQSNAQLYGQY